MTRRPTALAAALVALLAGAQTFAQTIDRAALDNAIDSVVFLRMNRTYGNAYFTSSGTGFLVHPDGYIITNWHVVADTIEIRLDGVPRDIDAKVLELQAVIHSGSGHERVLDASVVGMDRARDLALLKIAGRSPGHLDVADIPPVRVTDRVWVIGFPLGEMLAFDSRSRPTPAW